jgi:integrase
MRDPNFAALQLVWRTSWQRTVGLGRLSSIAVPAYLTSKPGGFLLRATLRRHDLAETIFYVREPKRIPLAMSQDEIRRLLAMARGLQARAALSLGYGCGLRAGEVVRLRAGEIDTAQMIIRVEQGKGRKNRHAMLSADLLDVLRQSWKKRPRRHDRETPPTRVAIAIGERSDDTRAPAFRAW